jgi:hypothetical protein
MGKDVSIIITGDSPPHNTYALVDPSSYSEAEYEIEVLRALTVAYPGYHCIPFNGSFVFEGERKIADLAMIHKLRTHWFLLEVELVTHSLRGHVIPQVQCFKYGEPEQSCLETLCRELAGLDHHQANSILQYLPRAVAVIVNRFDPSWEIGLGAIDVQLLTVSIYRNSAGQMAHKISGSLNVAKQSLGFTRYSALDKSFRLHASCGLPSVDIQIEDPFGVVSTWRARSEGGSVWITKCIGDPGLPHNETVQLIRTYDGKLTLRLPTYISAPLYKSGAN